MLDFIKKRLGLSKKGKRVRKKRKSEPFVVSGYPKKGWTIKNPSFQINGKRHQISWIKVADFQANGTDQFAARLTPPNLFNYDGLRIVEFANCGVGRQEAEEVKEELEEFIEGLREASEATTEIEHKGQRIELDLARIPWAEMPDAKTVGPRGGKGNGYDDELELSEEEMAKVCEEVIVK